MATTSVPKAMEALTLSKTKELKGVRTDLFHWMDWSTDNSTS